MSENDNGFDFAGELAQFDGDFAKAPVADDGKIPDGKYQVRIQDAQLTRSQTTQAPMLKFKLRVEGPSHIGRVLWRNSVIASDKLEYLKKDLLRVGLTLAKLSELPSMLSTVKGVLIEVTTKTNGDYQNIYIDKRINEAGGNFAGGAAPAAGSEFSGGGRGYQPSDSGVPF